MELACIQGALYTEMLHKSQMLPVQSFDDGNEVISP